MTKNKLYVLTLILCIVGYLWLLYIQIKEPGTAWLGCLFKKIYGIPCPACGATRSVLALMNGNIKESILINPIGALLFGAMWCFPIWILISIGTKKDSFYAFYRKSENLLQKKYTLILLAALMIINWLWNIIKGI